MLTKRKTRVVFMPLMKSYADTLIMFYLNYISDIEMGFTFGAYEDNPKAPIVDAFLRRIGHILIKRVQNDKVDPENGYIA